MNEKRDLEELLGEVLIDASNEEETRLETCRGFRRQVRRRSLLRKIGGALAAFSLAFAWFLPFKKDNPQLASVAPRAAVAQTLKKSPEPSGMSDEELLRSFPPGSCFLAEVNGKTVLFFTDESVKKRFLN